MKKTLVVSLVAALVGAVLILGPSAFGQSPGYRVIVNSSNPADQISKDLLSSYLLKKKSRWDHGITVEPADLDSQSQTRVALSEDVHGRSVASIKNYWQRQIFSGRNVPPPEVSSDSEMVAFVSSNPGGIGYVSASASLSGVKSIRVVN
ncbi:MAG: hypothetical protein AAGC60_13020 [Acidobacteriota bacterium]